MQTLARRRQAAFEELMAIGTARRGQLSEQYYELKGPDGKIRRRGPYYVWQRWVRGHKYSARIPKDAIAQVKADLKRGHQAQAVFDKLLDLMEESACTQDTDSKKSPDRTGGQRPGDTNLNYIRKIPTDF
ncbi:MAG: DUF6788 family protein [Verrucomicrobiota bacterium]